MYNNRQVNDSDGLTLEKLAIAAKSARLFQIYTDEQTYNDVFAWMVNTTKAIGFNAMRQQLNELYRQYPEIKIIMERHSNRSLFSKFKGDF